MTVPKHCYVIIALIVISINFEGEVCGEQPTDPPTKPYSHTVRMIEGWTVKIDDRLLEEENAPLADRAIKLLGQSLFQISIQLPENLIIRLQTVTLWLDLTHGTLRSPQYHPNVNWLKENGYNEELARCVHFPDAEYFASAEMFRIQPWFVLHELAHAWHDQFLPNGFADEAIRALWKSTEESGKYEKTLHVNGQQERHYALTDPMEFFAEFTESYFGVNDFFPFVRGELLTESPEIAELIRTLWLEQQKR